jgi:hypothetical protein
MFSRADQFNFFTKQKVRSLSVQQQLPDVTDFYFLSIKHLNSFDYLLLRNFMPIHFALVGANRFDCCVPIKMHDLRGRGFSVLRFAVIKNGKIRALLAAARCARLSGGSRKSELE